MTVTESELSPTGRALLVLELIQANPGITAERLADRLGVTDRAARRYVRILRDTGIPIESTPGRYGGYRAGRGLRLPPLMFTASEALGLVMSVLESHGPAGADDPVGSAVGKIMRVLPESVAHPVEAVLRVRARSLDAAADRPSPDTTAAVVQACAAQRRLRIGYRMRSDVTRAMEVDPWAVVVRYGRWYLLCWSHAKKARRGLRLDRIATIDVLPETFTPPEDLDPVRTLEEQFAEGWTYEVEVHIEAPLEHVAQCIPRRLARLERIDAVRTRLLASTDEPDWYAEQLATIRWPFTIVRSPEIREAAEVLAQRLLRASAGPVDAAVPNDAPAGRS